MATFEQCEREYLEPPDESDTLACSCCGEPELYEYHGKFGLDHEFYCDDCHKDIFG